MVELNQNEEVTAGEQDGVAIMADESASAAPPITSHFGGESIKI